MLAIVFDSFFFFLLSYRVAITDIYDWKMFHKITCVSHLIVFHFHLMAITWFFSVNTIKKKTITKLTQWL